eukprot:scaffold6.g2779.t1
MASRCPFHHLWAAQEAGAQTDASDKATSSGESAQGAQAVPAPACPRPAGAAASATATADGGAVCPLGFGSASKGPTLGRFHCPLCRCLYHDRVVTSCGHGFCRGCIGPCRDCPLCGADVGACAPDPGTQELVEKYIDALAATHTIWELEGAAGTGGGAGSAPAPAAAGGGGAGGGGAGPAPEGEERSRAAFLMHLGLRALAAGNAAAAAHRLSQAAQALEARLHGAGWEAGAAPSGGGSEDANQLRIRLGTVYGVLGDCAARGGDTPGALQLFQRSWEALEEAGGGAEVLEARAVAYSKAGEVLHACGDLAAAAELYTRALDLRRGALAGLRQSAAAAAGDSSGGAGDEADEAACASSSDAPPDPAVPVALGVAASLIKLADARQQMVEAGSAGGGVGEEALLEEAASLLDSVRGSVKSQPLAVQRKFAALEAFLAPGVE